MLAEGAPSGTQAVAITGPATVAAMVMSLDTDGGALEAVDVETIADAAVANASATLTLGGRTAFCALILGSGVGGFGGDITRLTNWTSRAAVDTGSTCLGAYTYDIVGSANVTAGWTQGTDDAVMMAVAVAEVEKAGGSIVPLVMHHRRMLGMS